jgi:hypothetical protein
MEATFNEFVENSLTQDENFAEETTESKKIFKNFRDFSFRLEIDLLETKFLKNVQNFFLKFEKNVQKMFQLLINFLLIKKNSLEN